MSTKTANKQYETTAFSSKTGTTVAGGNGKGSGLNQFDDNRGIDIDSSGNLYVSEYGNNRIMKWIPGASEGTVVAGGNGQGSANNQFARPIAVDVDSSHLRGRKCRARVSHAYSKHAGNKQSFLTKYE